MVNQGDVRVGDAERDAAAARLREHFTTGRLTLEEFRNRLAAAFAATTGRELGRLTADLPAGGVSSARESRGSYARSADAQAPAGGGRRWHSQPRVRRSRRPRLRLRTRLLLGCAAVMALWLLIGFSLPHNGLLLAALMLILGMMGLVVGLVVGLILLGRRALRRAAWLHDLPGLIDTPWLGRAMGAGRTMWGDRTMWMGRAAWPEDRS